MLRTFGNSHTFPSYCWANLLGSKIFQAFFVGIGLPFLKLGRHFPELSSQQQPPPQQKKNHHFVDSFQHISATLRRKVLLPWILTTVDCLSGFALLHGPMDPGLYNA